MTINVYNGEIFERTKLRYVLFALILITIIGLSLWKQNIIGVIVLFFILGAYFYYNIISNQIIPIKTETDHLIINNKIYLRGAFKAYGIEIEKNTQKIKNLILLTEKGHFIYTFHDKEDIIKDFIDIVNNNLTLVSDYNQSGLEKLSRILKL